MAIGVTVLGVLIAAIGVVGVVSPCHLTTWISALPPRIRFQTAITVRLVTGVFFLLAAPSCRVPAIVLAVGVLALVAALALGVLGQRRLDAFVSWWLTQPPLVIRVWSLVAVVFGGLLGYAGA